MTATNPDRFSFIGPRNQPLGSNQIQIAKSIGGGSAVTPGDGQDETTALQLNSHFVQAQVSRKAGGLCTFGEVGTPQNDFYATTSTGYVEFGRLRLQLGEGRKSLTVLLDFDDGRIRVAVRDAATYTLINDTVTGGKVESTDVTTRTVETLSYAGLTATDVVVVFEAKKNTTQFLAYCARVLPDKGDLSDGAVFRKIDDSRAGGNEHYTAQLLHSVDRDIGAAHKAQRRGYASFWPDDSEPILACHQTVVYPVAVVPVGRWDNELTLHLWHRVDDASVNLQAAGVDLFTGEYFEGEVSQIAVGSNLATNLTLNVSTRRERSILILLGVFSEDSGTDYSQSITSLPGSKNNIIVARHRVEGLTSPPITWTAGARWRLDIDDPSGSNVPDGVDFPDTRTVVHQSVGDTFVWPLYSEGQTGDNPAWLNSSYSATVTVIGQTTLHSLGWTVSEVDGRRSLVGGLRQGMPPSAPIIGRLYARQRDLYRLRTRCHGGLGFDPGNSKHLWASIGAYDTNWRDMAACMVAHDVEGLDHDGVTTRPRYTLVVEGVFWIVSRNRPGTERLVDLDIRASLASFGSGAWGALVDTSDTQTFEGIPSSGGWGGEGALDSADAVQYAHGNNYVAAHFLRGALDAEELRRRVIPFVPFRIAIEDSNASDPLVDASQRLLRLEVRGRSKDSGGSRIRIQRGQYQVVLLGWSARTVEGVG